MWITVFWVVKRCNIQVTSTLKVEAIRTSKTVVTTYKNTRHTDAEDSKPYLNRVNLKSR
jgi:hypothetical protein